MEIRQPSDDTRTVPLQKDDVAAVEDTAEEVEMEEFDLDDIEIIESKVFG